MTQKFEVDAAKLLVQVLERLGRDVDPRLRALAQDETTETADQLRELVQMRKRVLELADSFDTQWGFYSDLRGRVGSEIREAVGRSGHRPFDPRPKPDEGAVGRVLALADELQERADRCLMPDAFVDPRAMHRQLAAALRAAVAAPATSEGDES